MPAGTTATNSSLLEKIAQRGAPYIRDRILEEMFTDKIIPLETITMADPMVQVSTEHDQPMVLIPVEPNSRAVSVNWRGNADAQIISAPRVLTAFESISSNVYQKTKEELYVYERMGMPLTKAIEDRIPYDIQAIIDRTFILHAEVCVQAMQDEANGGTTTPLTVSRITASPPTVVQYSVFKGAGTIAAGVDDGTVYPLEREDLATLANILVVKKLKPAKILISDYDFNQMLAMTLESLGFDFTGRSLVEGMQVLPKLNNMEYVKTNKTDILRNGNVYVFTEPEFLGKFYGLGDLDFYVEQRANVLTFQARRLVAMSLVNVNAVGKLELYGGCANVTSDPSYSENFVPKDEDDLWDTNNRVTDGIYEPVIETY